MSEPARAIERFFRQRYGGEALYVPSGRLALYLAFREWLRPGDSILLSPIDDDVVFFTVLAAGLVPVLGPVDPRTGNLDAARVSESVWTRLRAVMTTNLYGIPDRMDVLVERSRRHGLVLLEDACQALDTTFGGRRIGQFGPVAAFSLSKHVDGGGGVLVFREGERRRALVRRAREEVRRGWWPGAVRAAGRRVRQGLLGATGVGTALARARRRLKPPTPVRQGHRMAYETEAVLRALRRGAGLRRFHDWVGIDNRYYRTTPPLTSMRDTLKGLEAFEETRRLRLDGAARLLALGLSGSQLPVPPDTALFRVPLFVRDREAVRAAFARLGLELDYIYDPPLDLYAHAELAAAPLASPPEARIWSRDVLPVDPRQADRFIALLDRLPPLQPAAPAPFR